MLIIKSLSVSCKSNSWLYTPLCLLCCIICIIGLALFSCVAVRTTCYMCVYASFSYCTRICKITVVTCWLTDTNHTYTNMWAQTVHVVHHFVNGSLCMMQ